MGIALFLYGMIQSKRTASLLSWSGKNVATLFIDANAIDAVARLLRAMGATEVFVFGSAVKGGLRPDSDVDLATKGLPSQVYFSAVSKASDLIGRPVDLVDLDDPTPSVRYLVESGELVRVG